MEKITFSCGNCQKVYNLTAIPLELPCGHHYCEACLSAKITCYQEAKVFKIPFSELKVPSFYREIVKNSQENSKKSFICETHKEETVKFYCEKHKQFLCCVCLFEHLEHKDALKLYSQQQIEKDLAVCEETLAKFHEKLAGLLAKLREISHKTQYSSAEISGIYSQIESFLQKSLVFPINFAGDCDKIPSFPGNPDKNIEKPPFLSQSRLVSSTSDRDFLAGLFKSSKITTNLLFRGSIHGFSARSFHENCDEKGANLVVIASECHYFGGYNSAGWSANAGFSKAEHSFLFSLDRKSSHKLVKSAEKAVKNSKFHGPMFGAGHDLVIASNCNRNEESYSNFGYTYESPFPYDSAESYAYFAGKCMFKVQDYEVFSVVFN